MTQNCQTHLKNCAAKAARFFKFIWLFSDIIHEGVTITSLPSGNALWITGNGIWTLNFKL